MRTMLLNKLSLPSYRKKFRKVNVSTVVLIEGAKEVSIEILGLSVWKKMCVHIQKGTSVQLTGRTVLLQGTKLTIDS